VPRPVAVRVTYREDTAYLVRFETAILKDLDLPEEWRRDFAQDAHRLAVRCLEADDLKNRRLDAAKKSKR
jgi:hypothetical protein